MEEKIQNNLILSESGEKITLMPSQTTYFVQIKKGLLKIDETAEVKKRRDTLSSIKSRSTKKYEVTIILCTRS